MWNTTYSNYLHDCVGIEESLDQDDFNIHQDFKFIDSDFNVRSPYSPWVLGVKDKLHLDPMCTSSLGSTIRSSITIDEVAPYGYLFIDGFSCEITFEKMSMRGYLCVTDGTESKTTIQNKRFNTRNDVNSNTNSSAKRLMESHDFNCAIESVSENLIFGTPVFHNKI